MGEPSVHLIDAHVYVFRAYFSLPEMVAPDGTPTHAAYGFTSTLIRHLARHDPSHVGCCFDHGLTSFRNERFPGYKASRGDEVPADLEPQFELCKNSCEALGIRVFEQEDYEADDVVATLTLQLLREGARVVVVSSDKDLCQLVTEDGRVVLHDLQRERTFDAAGVRERFGVAPQQIPDYLSLVGDAVDDLPGVPGFGPKSAAAVLAAFGALDAIPLDRERWRDVPVRGAQRLIASLREHRERALAMRELATVVREVPGLRTTLSGLAYRGPDRDRFQALCARLGWGKIATRLPDSTDPSHVSMSGRTRNKGQKGPGRGENRR